MRVFMQNDPASGEGGARYCQLILHRDLFGGWTVIRETGRQGGRPYVRKRYAADHDEALEVFMAWREQQLGKGLRVVFFEGEGPEAPR